MAKTNDDAARIRVAERFAKIADRSVTLDMCVEGVILTLIAVEDQLYGLPKTHLSEAASNVIADAQGNIVLARMALRGALDSSSPTDALMSMVNDISPEGGKA